MRKKTLTLRTLAIAAMARAPFLFWDGRKDSIWAQAFGPLESAVEHGGTRAQYAHVIAAHDREEYETVFGPLPDFSAVPAQAAPIGDAGATAAWADLSESERDAVTGAFVDIGKAIVAYERRITFAPSRFDRYVEAVTSGRSGRGLFNDDEIAGLRLFIGRANCTQCHNGPLLTDNEFHNTGMPKRRELATLGEVLDHYNRAPEAASGRSELRPLGLTPNELRQLEAFLRTLSGPLEVGVAAPGPAT